MTFFSPFFTNGLKVLENEIAKMESCKILYYELKAHIVN